MFGMYLSSVFVYMIIIYCTCSICKSSIRDKGWSFSSSETAKTNKWVGLFMLSAVPIVRVAVIVFIVYAATHTKEELEKWQAEVRERQNEGR